MMEKLIIDRKIWLRGEGPCSYLLRSADGKRCCLGIFGAACGIPDAALLYTQYPADVNEYQDKYPDWIFDDSGPNDECDTAQLMALNDRHASMGDEVGRETKIAAIFAKHGIEVSFIN